jgi:lysophospholipase L1-like esterase
MRIRREVVGALCALLVTACAAAAAGREEAAGDEPLSTTVDGVGVLPEPVAKALTTTTQADQTTVRPTTTQIATTTTALTADGNRILLLGDSILASTSPRYSNDTCKALVPLGWRVEVEAEVSRGIHFGNQVLAQRMKAGWDVGVVLLGSNDGSNSNEFLKQLNKIVTTFAPRPVVLITVSEFRDEMRAINDTIRAFAEVYPDQVSILDWAAISRDTPGVLNVDGIHPTPHGRQVLAEAIAAHIGPAPDAPGECLDSKFTDDSAGSIDGGSGGTTNTTKPRNTTPTTVKPGTTATTVKPATGTTTTVKPAVTTSTVPPGASTTVSATIGTITPTSPPATQPPTVPSTVPPTVPPTQQPTTTG